jgi:hypothetical protein
MPDGTRAICVSSTVLCLVPRRRDHVIKTLPTTDPPGCVSKGVDLVFKAAPSIPIDRRVIGSVVQLVDISDETPLCPDVLLIRDPSSACCSLQKSLVMSSIGTSLTDTIDEALSARSEVENGSRDFS